MAPRVDLCGRPAPVAVGAADVALLDLLANDVPGHDGPEQAGDVRCLGRPVPVVELETPDVSFTKVDARMIYEVRGQLGLEFGPECRVPTENHDNVAVAMCFVPGAGAGTAPRLQIVERRSANIEL
jgi:hypothetical protein